MSALVLGIVIPCRDEAVVIERKLANLAGCALPPSARPHRIVVVDDGSGDGTFEMARATCERLFAQSERVRASVVRNKLRPGKPGAIRAGLAQLGTGVDVLVLTDADVVLAEAALEETAQAFVRDPELALACGAQRFVRDLARDGSCRAADGGELVLCPSAFDQWTERVRRFESRSGKLFSVHGQLLAWRRSLALEPSFGIAADDLDLMLQVRSASSGPRRVELVPGAVFFEVKTPPGALRDAQELRRARAWVQAMHASRAPQSGLLDRAQWHFYRWIPELSPLLVVVALTFALSYAAAAGWLVLDVTIAVIGALVTTPAGRRSWKLLSTIRAATRIEARESLPERWEMKRT